jgi:hypothetical protein
MSDHDIFIYVLVAIVLAVLYFIVMTAVDRIKERDDDS